MTDHPSHHPLRAEQIVKLGELAMCSEREGETHTISLTGEMDLANVDDVQRELLRVEGTDAQVILIDLSGLTFLDSTGIRLLIIADARSRSDSNRLRMVRPPKTVQRVLRITGINDRLPFIDR